MERIIDADWCLEKLLSAFNSALIRSTIKYIQHRYFLTSAGSNEDQQKTNFISQTVTSWHNSVQTGISVNFQNILFHTN